MVDELQVELEPRRRARRHADGAPEEAVGLRRARGRGVVLLRVLRLLIEGPRCSAACAVWVVDGVGGSEFTEGGSELAEEGMSKCSTFFAFILT